MTPLDGAPTRQSRLASALTTSRGLMSLVRGGSGRPIVILHDLASSHESLNALAEDLKRNFQVIQVDLLGHGASDLRPLDLSISAQSDAVVEVLHDLGIYRPILVGHSLGGAVAVHVAAYHPDLVGKLVLISAGIYEYRFPLCWRLCRSRLGWHVLGLLGGPGAVERALRLARVVSGNVRTSVNRIESSAGWAALGRAFRQSTSDAALSELERLSEDALTHPTLVIWGTENRILPLASARVFFQGRHNVRFVEVAGTAHAVAEEAPRVVADLIREFLE